MAQIHVFVSQACMCCGRPSMQGKLCAVCLASINARQQRSIIAAHELCGKVCTTISQRDTCPNNLAFASLIRELKSSHANSGQN